MNRIVINLIAALVSTTALPVQAQDTDTSAPAPVITSPQRSSLARAIEAGFSAAYSDVPWDRATHDEAQRHYFFYNSRHFEPVWLTADISGQIQFSSSAQKILKLFANATREGLNPQDYLTPALDLDAAQDDPNKLFALETAFSAAALRYATHIHTGRLVPLSLSKNLDIAPKQIDEAALLADLASSEDPAAVLIGLEPTHPEFVALKAALTRFDGRSVTRAEPIANGPNLRLGMTDPRIPQLRTRLGLPATDEPLYNDELVDAVKAYQAANELDIDGVVGPATLSTLNGNLEITRADIIANMERWRWMPQDLGDFNVFVNIPEYRLAINNGDKQTYSTRVVVGSTKSQTPVFSDNIQHLVVNPYWNVPSSIVRSEIAPALKRNPGYAASRNMELFYNGNRISPEQINWSQVSSSNFPFRVRQRPGPGNSLGQIKFLFPNKHDVYLHDTPSRGLFTRAARAFSHGCVRVQDPMEFADALMANEPNISRASLEAMFGPSERWVNPQKQIPVHLAYFTIRAAPDGTLKAFNDIYGHNARVITALDLDRLETTPEIVAEAIPAESSGTSEQITERL